MKLTLALFTLAFLLLQSCNLNKTTSAVEYNDKIITEQTKVIQLTLDMINYIETDLAKCEELRLEIVKQCEKSIGIIEKMEPFDGDSQLKNAALDLFKFYKQTYSVEYKKLIEILNKGEEITQEDITEITDISTDIEKKEVDLEDKFEVAQNAFAKKYNIQIQENSLQKEIDAIE